MDMEWRAVHGAVGDVEGGSEHYDEVAGVGVGALWDQAERDRTRPVPDRGRMGAAESGFDGCR